MSKAKKTKQAQQDIPLVYDQCGCNVLDPNGIHTVNFDFELFAQDTSEDTRFDGDIDFQLPHVLPKNQKPPKIEISHPSTEWKVTLPVQIDDNFINTIKDKRLIYKFTFLPRQQGNHRGSVRTPQSRKSQQSNTNTAVQMPTLFLDASILLVRGGRFNPFLSFSKTFNCIPGFSNFTIKITINHPILSDAQIRKFQPYVCYLKTIHQIPESPLDFEQLQENKFLPPYLVVNPVLINQSPMSTNSGSTKNSSSSPSAQNAANTSYSTMPDHEFKSDIKLNTVLIFWGDQKQNIKELKLELHDRETKLPEGKTFIGSGVLLPEPKLEQTSQLLLSTSAIPSLSIEQILGVKKDSSLPPCGLTSIEFKVGRSLNCIKPRIQKDSSTIQTPFYIESGTYISCEIEDMLLHVPILQVPQQPATPTKKAEPVRKRSNSPGSKADSGKLNKTPTKVEKQLLFHRFVIVSKENLNLKFLSGVESQIAEINAKAFSQKDTSVVSTLKIESISSEAISGVIIKLPPEIQIYILETLENSESDLLLTSFFTSKTNDFLFYDPSQLFAERLYWQFDCAVKKMKMNDSIDALISDPTVYMQNSPISNCYTILNQLNQIVRITSFADIIKNGLWPKQSDLDMLNAKKGVLLSIEELAFPPLTPELIAIRSSRFLPKLTDDKPKEIPQFIYTPIFDSSRKDDTPPRDLKYYETRNKQYINELDRHNVQPRGLLQVTDDGEYEIWQSPSQSRAQSQYQDRASYFSMDDNDWELYEPEDFKSLAYEASSVGYFSKLRNDEGLELRNGQKFYSYRSPKSVLSKREQLKIDVNGEPWTNGDLSLANCDKRWLEATRGQVYSDFKTVGKGQDVFGDPMFQSLEDKYRPYTTLDKRNYVATAMPHKKRFYGVIAPISKNDPIRIGQHEKPSLAIEEPYKDPVKKYPQKVPGRPVFTTMYKASVPKGGTDSLAVRKITENRLPKIK